jgi:hypothetical protein
MESIGLRKHRSNAVRSIKRPFSPTITKAKILGHSIFNSLMILHQKGAVAKRKFLQPPIYALSGRKPEKACCGKTEDKDNSPAYPAYVERYSVFYWR